MSCSACKYLQLARWVLSQGAKYAVCERNSSSAGLAVRGVKLDCTHFVDGRHEGAKMAHWAVHSRHGHRRLSRMTA